MFFLDEPLEISAPLARQLAESLCPPSCLAYHAMWQYFRLIGLIGTISSDSDFLLDTIRELAQSEKFRRILISGSADYGMLAHVLAAYRLAGETPEITVLDLCETPLALNRWYAQRQDLSIETVPANILDFKPERKFDLICTHSFLGRLPPEIRKQALTRWHTLLRSGGQVVTTARVRHGAGTASIGFNPDEIQAFHDKALSLAQAKRDILDMPPNVLADAARQYAQNKITLPFGAIEDIRDYFTAAGFAPVRLTTAEKSLQNDRPSGPRAGWKTERVRIIAQRP